MKITAPSLIALCALLSLLSITGSAQAQGSSVSLTAKLVDTTPKKKKDPKEKKNNESAKAETEVNKLVISLRNVSREAVNELEVKYYFITRSSSADGPSTTTVGKEGSKKIDLAPNSAAEVESESLSTTYTDAYKPKKEKRVRASGEKIAGWGVKAMAGGQIAGEVYSSDSAKQAINAPADKK